MFQNRPFANLSHLIRLCALAASVASAGRPLLADVVVLANRTRREVKFRATEKGLPSQIISLAAADAVAVRCQSDVSIAFYAGSQPRRYALRRNSAYFFYESEESPLDLQRIGLGDLAETAATADAKVTPGDAAQTPPANVAQRRAANSGTLIVRVKLLVDEEERATQARWEERLRNRLATASRLFERLANVRFEVTAVGTWKSSDALTDFEESLRDFERKVAAEPANLAIGFTSQYEIPAGRTMLGGTHGPLQRHILIREWSRHISEPERAEILVHELGHYLGAVHSPEQTSVMRPSLGDRQALARQFKIGFDPLNLLAINLVADDCRDVRDRRAGEFTDQRRARLGEIYRVLATALPNDPAAGEYLRLVLLSRSATTTSTTTSAQPGQVSVPAPQGPDKVRPPAPVPDHRRRLTAAASEILKAIVTAAEANHRLARPSGEGKAAQRRRGDKLTEHYVKVAAAAALEQPEDDQRYALIIALAVAIDTSDWLRKAPVIGSLWREVESDAGRTRRLQVMDQPSMRGRHDLAEHFFLSAAIAAGASRIPAEASGLGKELRDSDGDSGFSFCDWAADLAGIAWWEALAAGKPALASLADGFKVEDYLPSVDGLPEGLSRDEFRSRFGSTSDRRFRRLDAEIRRRIAELPSYAGEKSKHKPESPAK